MLNLNGVIYETLQSLEAALDAVNDLPVASRQAIINEFNGVPNNPPSESPLRVSPHIHKDFVSRDISKVDFTMHLTEGVLLIKKVDMLTNGRPSIARYYWPYVSEENLICSIDYEFTDNAMKFMVDRKEKLKYYREDGTFAGPFTIHHRTYDFNNLKEATESIQERVQARRNIIDEVKVFLNGFIVQKSMLEGQNQGQANVTAMTLGGGFMQTHQAKINAWIETAAGDLKPYLQNTNNDTQEPFLDWYIQAGVRVRDYFLNRITY